MEQNVTASISPSSRTILRRSGVCCLYVALIPCLCTCLWGMTVLSSVFGIRTLSTSWASVDIPMTLDTRTAEAIGSVEHADFLQALHGKRRMTEQHRFLEVGDQVEISLHLLIARRITALGMVHVESELLTKGNEPTKNALKTAPSLKTESLFTFWRWMMAYYERVRNRETIRVILNEHYIEHESAPLVGIRVSVSPQFEAQLPEIYDAAIHVRKRLGLISQTLFLLRPSEQWSSVWTLTSTLAILTSSLAALAIYIAIRHISPKRPRPSPSTTWFGRGGENNEDKRD